MKEALRKNKRPMVLNLISRNISSIVRIVLFWNVNKCFSVIVLPTIFSIFPWYTLIQLINHYLFIGANTRSLKKQTFLFSRVSIFWSLDDGLYWCGINKTILKYNFSVKSLNIHTIMLNSFKNLKVLGNEKYNWRWWKYIHL